MCGIHPYIMKYHVMSVVAIYRRLFIYSCLSCLSIINYRFKRRIQIIGTLSDDEDGAVQLLLGVVVRMLFACDAAECSTSKMWSSLNSRMYLFIDGSEEILILFTGTRVFQSIHCIYKLMNVTYLLRHMVLKVPGLPKKKWYFIQNRFYDNCH